MASNLKKRILLSAAAGAGTLVIIGGNFACANLIIPPCESDLTNCGYGSFQQDDVVTDQGPDYRISVPDADAAEDANPEDARDDASPDRDDGASADDDVQDDASPVGDDGASADDDATPSEVQ